VKMNITQPPFNTSLMGVIRGVADYMDIEISTPSIYGRSGHAFLINIHEAICPSGPYCWNIDPFIALLENTGIRLIQHGFFSGGSTNEERNSLEADIRAELHKGNPCSMLNLDNQIITGFDEKGFICAQPWECDFPPANLTAGSWEELGDEIHVCFFSFEKIEPADPASAIRQSLLYALDLNDNPENHTNSPYSCGAAAYSSWLKGIENGHGAEHGNWWNATVWSECRKQGALYFAEIADLFPSCSKTALKLQALYNSVGDALAEVSDKEMEPASKIEILKKAATLEAEAADLIEVLDQSIPV